MKVIILHILKANHLKIKVLTSIPCHATKYCTQTDPHVPENK